MAQHGGGHALRGRRRTDDEGRPRVAQQRGAPPPVHQRAQPAGRRHLHGEPGQHGGHGQHVPRMQRRPQRGGGQPGHRHPPAHGGQFLQHRGHRRPPAARTQQQRRPGQQGEERRGVPGGRPPGEQGRRTVGEEQRDGGGGTVGRPGGGQPGSGAGAAREHDGHGGGSVLPRCDTGGGHGTFCGHEWMDSLCSECSTRCVVRSASAPPAAGRSACAPEPAGRAPSRSR